MKYTKSTKYTFQGYNFNLVIVYARISYTINKILSIDIEPIKDYDVNKQSYYQIRNQLKNEIDNGNLKSEFLKIIGEEWKKKK